MIFGDVASVVFYDCVPFISRKEVTEEQTTNVVTTNNLHLQRSVSYSNNSEYKTIHIGGKLMMSPFLGFKQAFKYLD